MIQSECCICACNAVDLFLDEKSAQPDSQMLQFQCCERHICPICIDKLPRLEKYCPYCQDTGGFVKSNSLLNECQGGSILILANKLSSPSDPEKVEEDAPDVLHFVDPTNDTINLLSIRYGVPPSILRKTNSIYSDNLLAARKTILIPGKYYKGGLSLSPRPVDGEEIELKKNKIRRWMVSCKSADYDLAIMYLEQSQYNLDAAINALKQDEEWELQNPLLKNKKSLNKSKRPQMTNSLRK